MRPLARKIAASATSAALVLGAFPRAAWAGDPSPAAPPPANASAAAVPARVDAAAAMEQMRQWGVYKGDGDVLKTYLGDSSQLTPLGLALYQSMSARYLSPKQPDRRGLADEIQGLKPVFDQLREAGPFTRKRAEGLDKTLRVVEQKMGKIDQRAGNSIESQFRRGVELQALMTGASVTEPPKLNEMVQVTTDDGYEFYDRTGLVFRTNKNNATTYSRELQKLQRQMNQSRPPQLQFVPETGRYNKEMFSYTYWSMKNQYDALNDQMNRERALALAELLNKANSFRDDMWFTDPRILKDLEAEAARTTYNHQGRDYTVLELVDKKFRQRKAYFDGALKGIARFKADMDAYMEAFAQNPVVSDAQVQTLAMDQKYAQRYLSLSALETLKFDVANQIEKLDPASPDSEQIMKALDASDLPADVKAAYKLRVKDMIARLRTVIGVLEETRQSLSSADYAGSMEVSNAALAASQQELNALSGEYAMYVEVPTVAYSSRQQDDVTWLNFGSKFTRWAYRSIRPSSDYTQAIEAMKANRGKFDEIVRLIADGRSVDARQAVIAMNPDAIRKAFTGAAGPDARITDALRLSASLKVNRDRIGTVFETNKWLDTAGYMISWTVSLAVAAPIMRWSANGAAKWLMNFTGEASTAPSWALTAAKIPGVSRTAIVLRETLLHTAARLQTLEPSSYWVASKVPQRTMAGFLARRGLAAAVRARNAFVRQVAFTGMSAGVSGAFSLGTFAYDQATLWATKPGGDVGVNVPGMGRVRIITPEHSMFSGDLSGAAEALWTGASQGIWWANAPMEGYPWLHPAMLGYIGLPSSAFRGTRLMGAMDVVGARGVMGSAVTGFKAVFNTGAAEAAAAAGDQTAARGFLEKLAEAGEKGTVTRMAGAGAAFSLGMADGVAKYALFSDLTGWAGRELSYHVFNRGEQDVERRIRGANATETKILSSPAWMLIPTYSAHQAREAALYQRAGEGMEQFDALGLTKEYANAPEGKQLRFVKTPKPPLSQRIFDASAYSDTGGDYWVVTKEVRRMGQRKEMLASLGGKGAKAADIPPQKFYEATQIPNGQKFINLDMNDEVRLVAHQNFVESLLSNPERAKKILAVGSKEGPPLGSEVDGWRITPEVQKDVAVGLYTAEMQIGKAMPKTLAGRVGEILDPYLKANDSVRPASEKLVDALAAAKGNESFLDVLEMVQNSASRWKASGAKDYMAWIGELRAKVEAAAKNGGRVEVAGELRAKADALEAAGERDKAAQLRAKADALKGGVTTDANERALLLSMADYVTAIERRFNSFNNVGKVRALGDETLGALRVEFEGRDEPTRLVKDFTSKFDAWAKDHPEKAPVDDLTKPDNAFKRMIRSLNAELDGSKAKLTGAEYDALQGAVKSMDASPWVLHDSKGNALPSWRPEQFETFMNTLADYAAEGRAGGSPRLFEMLKTGGGKTMLGFEGMLPLIEADAGRRSMKVVFLTVQSNLEAQARMEFIAYKKIGSVLTFDTYEGFKTKIAEGKTKGHSALRDYWILGDEMDGAALQPALTIGQVTGGISKLDPLFNRIEELDQGLGERVSGAGAARDARVLTEARRALNDVGGLDVPSSDAMMAEAIQLESAAAKLSEARGPLARQEAEADIRRHSAALDRLLGELPARDAKRVIPAQDTLSRLGDAMVSSEVPTVERGFRKRAYDALFSKPGETTEAKYRADVADGLKAGFARQNDLLGLTGSEEGLARLASEAQSRAAKIESRISRLNGEADAAEASAKEVARKAGLDPANLPRASDAYKRLSALRERVTNAERARALERYAELRSQPESSRSEAALRDAAKRAGFDLEKPLPSAADALGLLGKFKERLQGPELGKALAEYSQLKSLTEAAESLDRAAALRRETALLDGELKMARRFVAADPGQVLAGLQEDIAAARFRGGSSSADAAKWQAEADALGAGLPEEGRAAAKEHADALARLYDLGRQAKALDADIAKARSEGRPTAELETRRAALESDFQTTKGEIKRLKAQITAGPESGDLGAALRRLDGLSARAATLEGRIKEAKARGEATGTDQAELSRVRAEREAALKTAARSVRDDLAVSADEVVAEVKDGRSGWESRARRLLEQRRGLMTAFAGDENPEYTLFRTIKDDMEPFAKDERFKSQDKAVYTQAQQDLIRYVEGKPLPQVAGKVVKMAWQVFTGQDVDVPVEDVGLTRLRAAQLLKALFADTTMPSHQRDALFWSLAPSVLSPGGEKNSSWMRTEILRQFQGYFEKAENPDGVRLDSRSGKINVVHNGQWFESMDNATRRFWELDYGVDLTLPYTNQSISTIKDVTMDREARFISFSGTAGKELRKHFKENSIRLGGEGSKPPAFVRMDPVLGGEARLERIHQSLARLDSGRGEVFVDSFEGASPKAIDQIKAKLGGQLGDGGVVRLDDFKDPAQADAYRWLTAKRELQGDSDHVVLRPTDSIPEQAQPAVKRYFAERKLDPNKPVVMRISDLKGATAAETDAAQAWLRDTLRPGQGRSSLLVLSVSGTRTLRSVRNYLIAHGVKPEEISMVFSDTEYLRNNVPEAKVEKQMNLDALNDGKARVLILDTRVGGRGLDLNFKGTGSKTFRGYSNFEMQIVDPQKMSQVHLLQAEGRIDEGRVLAGARREFSLLMDVGAAAADRPFREMLVRDDFFTALRAEPDFAKFAQARGITEPDWAAYHEYVSESVAQNRPGSADLARDYRKVVKTYLEEQQGDVEQNQLRSAAVLNDGRSEGGRYPGIEGVH